MFTDAKRLQQIIKNLLSNAFKFTHHGQVTLTVEPADGGLEPGQRGAEPGRGGAGVRGGRHRHRHPGRQAADHLRGVPAGRRQHQPQVRRHRPGPGDQPRAVAAAGRRDPAGVDARPRQHVHLYLPATYTPAAPAAQGARRGRADAALAAPPTVDRGREPNGHGRTCRPAPSTGAGGAGPAASTRSATTATTSSPATACC